MKHKYVFLLFSAVLFLQACIKDDFVEDTIDPEIRITTSPDAIAINSEFQFEAQYFNNIGQQQDVPLDWQSSDPSVLSIDATGLAQANALGEALIIANYTSGGLTVSDTTSVVVGETTVVESLVGTGVIQTTSFYDLEGDFTISETATGVLIDVKDNYKASTGLPGFYLYLTNNASSIADAHEVSMITVFEGAHQYEVEGVSIQDFSYLLFYCKPFNVKVGDGEWTF